MKGDNVFIWILFALLAAAIMVTVLWGPRRSKHGYGSLLIPGPAAAHPAVPERAAEIPLVQAAGTWSG